MINISYIRFFNNVFYSIMHAVEKQHTYTKHIHCAIFFYNVWILLLTLFIIQFIQYKRKITSRTRCSIKG